MKNIFSTFLLLVLCTLTACAQDKGSKNDTPKEGNMKIKIIIGGTEFTADLYENETAKAFAAKLPITVNMTDLNGNEKYYYFPQNLPSGTAQRPETIHTGDIMLYSTNCLVLFYKTFSTSYSYIKIGRITNTSGLETALGKGNIEVTFEASDGT